MRPEILFPLFAPVTRLKGVGPNMGKGLARLLLGREDEVPIVRDLVFHLPVSVLDRRNTWPLSQTPEGVVGTFVVTVERHEPPPPVKRAANRPYRVYCENETGTLTLVFFHAREDYLKQVLPVGSKRVISGLTEHYNGMLQMSHPHIIAPLDQLEQVKIVEPVYPLTAMMTSRRVKGFVDAAMQQVPELPEWIAPEVVARHGWLPWKQALVAAHHPKDNDEVFPHTPARARLAYDELMMSQMKLAQVRKRNRQKPGRAIQGDGSYVDALRAALPFQLTKGQEEVFAQIEKDMSSGARMTRLLQGDVGSGKTIVALLAMLRVAESGAQAALMVPTELVAIQHYEKFTQSPRKRGSSAPETQPIPALASLVGDCKAVLLTGSIKGRAREEAYAAIASGEAQIIIGTHALFQEAVEFKDLALTVIDEQHRFGVDQRMRLTAKGEAPHILHMTATPIPRSLTMILYGDMDVSLLKEKPPGRADIVTRMIAQSRYKELLERLKRALDRGEKAYWVCPAIEEGQSPPSGGVGSELHPATSAGVAAAESRYHEFKAMFGSRVGMVHGGIKAVERTATMAKFAGQGHDLLVGTTVIEVGVDVKDATIMIIEQAERFGLSQLHQLRGRVGRSDKPSYCILLYSDALDEKGAKRLQVVRDTQDGFVIADTDLKLRGGGEVLGTRQSGLPGFRFVDFYTHEPLLGEVREDIDTLLAADPELTSARGEAVRVGMSLFPASSGDR